MKYLPLKPVASSIAITSAGDSTTHKVPSFLALDLQIKHWRDCFDLECEALKKVRNEMGLKNVQLMIPFVRTVKQAKDVIDILAENGLKRDGDLKIIMMSELPSNSILANR